MRTVFSKAIMISVGSMLLYSQKASAGIGSAFEEFIGKEFSTYEGLYVMAGVIISSLVVYILFNHFDPEEKKPVRQRINHTRERHRHHHRQQRVIRKTP